jgi:hypothetical protein
MCKIKKHQGSKGYLTNAPTLIHMIEWYETAKLVRDENHIDMQVARSTEWIAEWLDKEEEQSGWWKG